MNECDHQERYSELRWMKQSEVDQEQNQSKTGSVLIFVAFHRSMTRVLVCELRITI